jgi:hypothetical protein
MMAAGHGLESAPGRATETKVDRQLEGRRNASVEIA